MEIPHPVTSALRNASARYCCPIFSKIWMRRQIIVGITSVKCHVRSSACTVTLKVHVHQRWSADRLCALLKMNWARPFLPCFALPKAVIQQTWKLDLYYFNIELKLRLFWVRDGFSWISSVCSLPSNRPLQLPGFSFKIYTLNHAGRHFVVNPVASVTVHFAH